MFCRRACFRKEEVWWDIGNNKHVEDFGSSIWFWYLVSGSGLVRVAIEDEIEDAVDIKVVGGWVAR